MSHLITPKVRRFLFGCILMVTLPAISVQAAGSGEARRDAAPWGLRVNLLWNGGALGSDSVDQESFKEALGCMGFTCKVLDQKQLRGGGLDTRMLLVVPHASAVSLSPLQLKAIIRTVRNGMCLITDGPSPLVAELGITLGKAERVSIVKDRGLPDVTLRWADAPNVHTIAGYPATFSRVLYSDSVSDLPLVVLRRLGQGRCLVLAPLFDPVSGHGYSRFPTLPNAIISDLQCSPPFRANALAAYFDPGYRYGVPIEKLAARWRQWGIRAVHAAAWYHSSSPPYDYKRLIDAAHRNGVAVYAWLEWPHVGSGFWNQHPEWRQKNALLRDAKLDFLHLMDLQNPDCMNAALNDLSELLKEDWDGIDIAEFTITGAGGEALAGPARPEYFVPFTESAIAEFKQVAGYDPRELEDPTSPHFWKRNPASLNQFYDYRKSVNDRLLRQVVQYIIKLKKEGKRDWELIHTIVDNSLHPEFDYLLGFNQQTTVRLVNEFGITLNVEDPFMEWMQSPERYRKLRSTLVSLIPDRSSMIDINVVPTHPPTQAGFATQQATGIELLQQVQMAGEQSGRVCVYCESSVFAHDWRLMPYALAAGASIQKAGSGWEISCPRTATLKLSGSVDPWLDGKPWPCRGPEGLIVPAGQHRLSVRSRSVPSASTSPAMRLLSLSDELLGCKVSGAEMEITYRSPARCILLFNIRPARVLLDGVPLDVPVLAGEKSFVVVAPSGEHRLTVSGR